MPEDGQRGPAMRILLLEDEPTMAKNVCMALMRQDILMHHASTLELAK
jgi:DNA-binding response OmpR family regulator